MEILIRIKSAIEFLKDGLPFRVENLYLGFDSDKYLNITGASKNIHFENITKDSAIKELEIIKKDFFDMVTISEDLKIFIENKNLKFNLDFDYGMGDIRVCSEKDGALIWNSLLN